MSRWWRAYDEAVDDPKLGALTDRQHRAWFNLCCICSQNNGKLPATAAVAFKLRVTADRAKQIIAELAALGLVDIDADGVATMHNWSGRQYKTDVTDPTNATRQKRYRDRHRVTDRVTEKTVTDKRPETETETETDNKSEAHASAVPAVPDPRKELFDRGLKLLAQITGKTPDSSRSLVGRWLKTVNDEAIHVLGAIDEAARNRVADPVAWINKTLQPYTGDRHGKRSVQDAARDIAAKFGAVPAGDGGGASGAPVRLLPAR